MRDAVYPRTGWRRAIEYIGYRIKRLPDTPHKIALGFACGVFVSFSPLFGLHFFAAALMAMMMRGNVLASLLGTFFGNPVTFPLIATVSYRTGHYLLGAGNTDATFHSIKVSIISGLSGLWHSFLSIFGVSEPAWSDVGFFLKSLFLPYFVGGLIPGFLAGFACYLLARPLVAAYQKTRRARLSKKHKKRTFGKAQPLIDPAE